MRIERDSMGDVTIPDDALWGAQTQRAVKNFPISGLRFGRRFIQALGWVKRACAQANVDLGSLGGLPHRPHGAPGGHRLGCVVP